MKNLTKKFFAVLLASSLALCPVVTTASSTSRVDKTVSVKKGDILDESDAPKVKIELEDEFAVGDSFYLTLSNAKWYYGGDDESEIEDFLETTGITADCYNATTNPVAFSVTLQSPTTIKVTLEAGTIVKDDTISVLMVSKITGKKPTCKVSSDSTISVETVSFVKVNSADFEVSVDDEVPSFYDGGECASFTITESVAGSLYDAYEGEDYAEIELYLDSYDYEIVSKNNIKLTPAKGFYGEIGSSDYTITQKDENTILIKIDTDAIKDLDDIGELYISGLKVELIEDEPVKSSLSLDVSLGSTTETITIADTVSEGLNIVFAYDFIIIRV